MAVKGDAYTLVESNADSGTTTIQPAGSGEIRLQYIFHSGAGKLEITDGSNTALAFNNSTGNCVYGESIPLTNGVYAIYTNLSGGTQVVTCLGVYTKAT